MIGRMRAFRTFGIAAALASSVLAACAVTAPRPIDPKTAKIVVVGASGRNGSAIVEAFEAAGVRPVALTLDVARAKE